MHKIIGVMLLIAITFSPEVKASLGWFGPEPFRLQQLQGRDFDYNLESFLQRLSFSPLPLQPFAPLWQQDGWYGTGGSTRSREFYVHSVFQKTVQFDFPAFAGVRVSRAEDLDGRYDRQLIGMGYRSQTTGTEYSLWGDVAGAKDLLDLQFEVNQAFTNGSWLKSALVLTDVVYNSKTYTENQYQTKPVTLYLSGGWQLGRQQLYGFTNINLKTEFSDSQQQLAYSNEQYAMGLGWNWLLNAEFELTLQGQGNYVKRQQYELAANAAFQTLQRQYYQLSVELRQATPAALSYWYGIHALSLNERDSRFAAGAEPAEYRRELYSYAGLHWQYSNTVSLRPTLYLGYASVRGELQRFTDEPLKDSGLLAKISPNITIRLQQSSGARLVINPSVKLHNLQFGGGNIQLDIPF
ncbi:hypothetical protein WG68_09015 [Arsukibacterium ikkense]|uniref:Uncharacterized protein n=1 Tax=Arsukibacterium ikkense TaxID=336831 RepID=A0A0M2V854_9GAMM|nr:hypothetical protein [Arsukibacterium ikkense]KKO45835.1 hypothetical protein WG68_09015 [Arsukibacterium ikkense]